MEIAFGATRTPRGRRTATIRLAHSLTPARPLVKPSVPRRAVMGLQVNTDRQSLESTHKFCGYSSQLRLSRSLAPSTARCDARRGRRTDGRVMKSHALRLPAACVTPHLRRPNCSTAPARKISFGKLMVSQSVREASTPQGIPKLQIGSRSAMGRVASGSSVKEGGLRTKNGNYSLNLNDCKSGSVC